MTRSTSDASTPATASASRAACTDRVVVVSSSAAMRRSRMPVRLTIHSSEVSTMVDSSSLVMTRSGAYIPHPVMTAFAVMPSSSRTVSFARINLDQRLLALDQRAALDEGARHLAAHVRLDLVEQLHRLDQANDRADP